LNGNLAAHAFQQQVAIIGVTGLGLTDVVPTPVANLMDGVEVQAQFIENLLGGVRLVRPWPIPFLELLAFLGGAAALIVLLPRVRPVTSVAVFLGLAAVLSAIALVAFTRAHVLSDPSFPVTGHAIVLVVFLMAGFAASDRTRRELRFMREIFGRYLTDEVVASLLDAPGGLRLGGEQRPITILMSDLRGFTSLSGRLTPEQVVAMLNRYLSTMVEVIVHYQGTINEFIGDAILVIFGAPVWRQDDAPRAVACAVAMQLAMATVNAEHRRAGLPDVEMGIGVHTGEVVVGNIGSHRRAKYGVVGSHVNLTSRIQSYTIGGQILISEATRQAVEPLVKLSRQMEVEAKGIAEPITLYELQGIGGVYNLFLPEREEALVPLWQALPFQYTVLEGEHISRTAVYTGSFVRLSAKGGEVCSDHPIAPWSNIKVHLIGHNGGRNSGELYAKVLRHFPEGRAGFYVSFTSVSPEAAVFFQRLLASGSPNAQ
jgi:adenylate cyclase